MPKSSRRAFYLRNSPDVTDFVNRFCRLSKGLVPTVWDRSNDPRVEREPVVHGVPEVLLAAEVTLCSLNRRVAEQELNLFKFAAASVTYLRAGPAQIMRRNVLQSDAFAAVSHNAPYKVLRDALAPYLSTLG